VHWFCIKCNKGAGKAFAKVEARLDRTDEVVKVKQSVELIPGTLIIEVEDIRITTENARFCDQEIDRTLQRATFCYSLKPMYSTVVFMTKMFLLNRSIALGEVHYKCCCFAPGEPPGPGLKFSIPETPGVKVGGWGWLP